MRRTPLKRKREQPRRKAPERCPHQRIKPKAGARPTAAEMRHLARVAALPCLVCGRPATVHHVTSDGLKRIGRSHRLIAPLCRSHHQKVWDPKDSDPISVEGLGHAGFTAKFGIDLLKEAIRLWEEGCEE